MHDPRTLDRILDLETLDDNHFTGHSPQEQRRRVFGGQVVAQALVAAGRTVEATHEVNSLHGYFLRGGDVGQPIDFGVERLREGRAFSARRVTASQDDRVILVLSTSFHRPHDDGDFQQPAPPGVPQPEHLPATRFSKPGIIETLDASYDQPGGVHRRLWFRAGVELPSELHAAAVAYATDHGPFGAARRLVDVSGPGRFDQMFRTSLDHAIWFHQRPDVSDWLLYDIEAVAHRDERVLTQGRIYDRTGRRIATVTQEILARNP